MKTLAFNAYINKRVRVDHEEGEQEMVMKVVG